MAKDPAFLFYPGDYVSGTMHLNFECKGAYMDLLMVQFQQDRLTEHMIKQVLGHMYDHVWPHISSKFRFEDGFFWNERLRIEKEKRINFCESRSNNKKSKFHMIRDMLLHMENENIDIISKYNSINKTNMTEQKKVVVSMQGLTSFEVSFFVNGNDWQNKEIENFLLKNDIAFESFLMKYKFLAQEDAFHKVIQYFIIHFQMGGEQKSCTELTKYFRNWINKTKGNIDELLTPFDNNKKGNSISSGPTLKKLG